MMKIVGVIPARYQSSRFPGKPLADICGKPLVWWVYSQAAKVKNMHSVLVATDDERIRSACGALGIKTVMTLPSHKTGTDRVGEVARKIKADIYVNIQGDEPLLDPQTIDKAIRPLLNRRAGSASVTNLMTPIKRMSELLSATVPKVVVNAKSEGVFLSRSPVPYPKSGQKITYYKQVCVYGFTPEALKTFCSLGRGPVERAEDIEILRFIENRIAVQYLEVPKDTVAVDTPSDLELVRSIIKKR
jgi:3-deoxy-manno-octulosonate cytidylyltransferase (CMP-KDO synthetase)